MKNIIKDNNIIIHIENSKIDFDPYIKDELEDNLKNLIISLKKKYYKNISGFYISKVYHNKNYGLIIELIHESDLDFFPDLIDLKVVIYYNSLIYLKIEDYFLIKDKKEIYYYKDNFYIPIELLTREEQIKLSEFGEYIYGDNLKKIKKDFMLI